MPDSPGNSSFVLASRSPQRQTLLRDAGFDFTVEPAEVDEDNYESKTMPANLAIDLAQVKAHLISDRFPDRVILGADTVVAFGDHIIGKPLDAAHAREIVRLISGATVIVITGVAVAVRERSYMKTARMMSAARIRSLSDIELEKYMLSGAWRNKAGAFGLQDENTIVGDVRGCRTNVMGLPIKTAALMLAEAGILPKRKD
ncbi:Maf family protein [soil metagenome]